MRDVSRLPSSGLRSMVLEGDAVEDARAELARRDALYRLVNEGYLTIAMQLSQPVRDAVLKLGGKMDGEIRPETLRAVCVHQLVEPDCERMVAALTEKGRKVLTVLMALGNRA